MYILLADRKVDRGNGQDDDKEYDRRGGSKGGIAAALAVKHIVDITDDGVHVRDIEICAEKRNRVAVRLECADKAGNYKVEKRRRDHRQGYLRKYAEFRRTVNPRGVVVILIDGCKRAGQDQDLKGHYDPDRVKRQDEHLCPVWSADEVDRRHPEEAEKDIYKSVRIIGGLEKYHEYQTDCQCVCDIGQEIYRLEELAQSRDR